MAQKFQLLKSRFEHPAGTTIYYCTGSDCGLCYDDEDGTGIEHYFMTTNPDGSYPGFTVPVGAFEEITEYRNLMISNLPKTAVCLIVLNSLGQLLTTTRRNTDILSLPGGKVDEDESPVGAVIRETAEETGIDLTNWAEHQDAAELTPIFSEVVKGDDGKDFYCVTYFYTGVIDMNVGETWVVEQGIKVSWQDVSALLTGAFADYNMRALDSLNIILERNTHAIAI